MRKNTWTALLVALSLLTLLGEAVAQDGHKAMASHHGKMAPGAWIFGSQTLYACSHHPDVITAKADSVCAVDGCSLTVEPLSEERMAEIREADLVACPMASCSVAATADAGLSKCPKCGMKLVEVEHHHGEKSAKEPAPKMKK